MTTQGSLRSYAEMVGIFNVALEALCRVRPPAFPPKLWESMTYSLQAGGKRIRPALCLLTGQSFGVSPDRLMPMALALEMIHTASLIHDDLPAMDDDALRRGRPTNHVVFGEAMATLAVDSLLMWSGSHAARDLVARSSFSAHNVLKSVTVLLDCAGPGGICGGQVLDIDESPATDKVSYPLKVAAAKTGALLRSSVLAPAILCDANNSELKAFSRFGVYSGVAFQIADDVLDMTGSSESLGKTPGKDSARGKPTFASVLGLVQAMALEKRFWSKARQSLASLDRDVRPILELVEALQNRTK